MKFYVFIEQGKEPEFLTGGKGRLPVRHVPHIRRIFRGKKPGLYWAHVTSRQHTGFPYAVRVKRRPSVEMEDARLTEREPESPLWHEIHSLRIRLEAAAASVPKKQRGKGGQRRRRATT